MVAVRPKAIFNSLGIDNSFNEGTALSQAQE